MSQDETRHATDRGDIGQLGHVDSIPKPPSLYARSLNEDRPKSVRHEI